MLSRGDLSELGKERSCRFAGARGARGELERSSLEPWCKGKDVLEFTFLYVSYEWPKKVPLGLKSDKGV